MITKDFLNLRVATMIVKIKCPTCNQLYSVDESIIGEVVECIACNHVFVAQKKEPIKLERDNPSSDKQEQSEVQAQNETAIKRIQVLMDLQDWDKARLYCENALDSAPENPELYLMLCLINHKLSSNSFLEDSNIDLAEDKYFATAIKFSSADYKQHLLDIQFKIQQNRLQRYEFFLRKCLEENNVSIVSMLSKRKNPLAEDFFFQKALEFASPEQKRMLLQLQDEQENSTSSLRKIWRKTQEIRKGSLLGVAIGMILGLIAIVLSIVDGKDLEEIIFCAAIFLSAGLVLGGILVILWKKFYKPEAKKATIALRIVFGVTFTVVVLALIQSGIDYPGRPRSMKSVSIFEYMMRSIFDDDFIVVLIIVIAFCLIWLAIWDRRQINQKMKTIQIAQHAESEYNLWKGKIAKEKSKENESSYDQKRISSSDISFDYSLKSLEGFHSAEEEDIRTKGMENLDFSPGHESDENENLPASKKVLSRFITFILAVIFIVFAAGSQVAVKLIHKSKYGDLVFGTIILFVILGAILSYGISKYKSKNTK